jgi:hypothetical protein
MINEENRNLEYCASLRVKNYLETAVEFLLLPRQRGLSRVDPWLRPRPAKTDHFLAGVNSIVAIYLPLMYLQTDSK